jgi:hypothetical protein
VARSSDQCNELSGTMKYENCFGQVVEYQVLKNETESWDYLRLDNSFSVFMCMFEII